MKNTHQTIPVVDRNVFINAMNRFDLETRNSSEWQSWSSSLSHKYALFHDLKIYPVKKIIFMATNLPVSIFSDGNQSNNMEGQDTARTRLFWNADFATLLNETFPGCIFCSEEISKRIIASHGSVFAVEDKYPVTRGHLLIIT